MHALELGGVISQDRPQRQVADILHGVTEVVGSVENTAMTVGTSLRMRYSL
jgi:hypothetical protein